MFGKENKETPCKSEEFSDLLLEALKDKIRDKGVAFFGFILVVFAISYVFVSWMQTSKINRLEEKIDARNNLSFQVDRNGTINGANFKLISTNPPSDASIVRISEEVNIPLEILKQVKYFNEVMTQKQNDTIQIIVYVIAFFSIVAAFFGYKTINSIKESAEKENNKLAKQYELAHDLLNEQIALSNRFYDSSYRKLSEEYKRVSEEYKKMKEDIQNTRDENQELKDILDKEMRFSEKHTSSIKSDYSGKLDPSKKLDVLGGL